MMNTILKNISCFKIKVNSLRIFDSVSSSLSFTPQRFDVFISYRGADTRKNFVSFLYRELVSKGIRTFKDDQELETGCPISADLGQAIKGSRFAIVVVSATYTASNWCLEELVKIMDYEEKGLITVLPIFYEIDPAHVRRQIGDVAKHFKKHEKRCSKERVRSWRHALFRLANISGDCSRAWEDDCKLVEGITERIENMLSSETPSSGNNLVGIDEHMSKVYPLLGLDSNESVKVIGIWGRGSNGRSVLARTVYEKISPQFQAHCFLENVRKMSVGRRKTHLQEELLWKMQGEVLNARSSQRCLNAIKARLRNKKVLIVANDVDKNEQLDVILEEFSYFGPGSRMIITTQDRQLLTSSGVKSVYEGEIFRCYELLGRSLAFKQMDDPVSFDRSTYRAFNLSGDVFSTLKYLAAMLCGSSQLRERMNTLINSL